MELKYSVREINKFIKESASEFRPKLGNDVERDNKKNNDKAYKEASKLTNSFDGGIRQNKKLNASYDDNRGMQDLAYENMTDDFKNKVKSQMKGYVSKDAEDKHSKDAFGNAEFNDIKKKKKKNEKFRDGKQAAKEIGLTSRLVDFDEKDKTVYEDNSKMFKLKFKNTVFVTENHMMSKIPDDFKVEGKKFIMMDKNNHEYLVEWAEDPSVIDLTKINEQKNRIKHLFNYKSGETSTSCKSRLTEENKVNDMLNKARKLFR